jgi:amino acid transporter
MLHFRRTLGFWDATFLGIGSLIGAGIFVLSGHVVNLLGAGALLAYGVAFITALLHALAYSELATTYHEEGGGFVYVKKTMGNLPAFITGWLLLSGSLISSALIALGFAEYVINFFPNRAVLMAYAPAVAIGVTLFLVILNIVSARRTEVFEDVASVIKVGVLLLLIAAALPLAKTEAFRMMPSNVTWVDFMSALTLCYVAFIGFESIAVANEEVVDPKKNIPRAILTSLLIVTLIYFGLIAALVGTGKFTGMSQDGLALANLAEKSLGAIGFPLLLFGGAIATLSALNATIFSVSRNMYGLGRDHFLPKKLSELHPKFKTPYWALAVLFVFVTLMISVGGIDTIARLTAASYLFAICFTHTALIVSRFKHHHLERPFKLFGHILIPVLGLILNVVILAFFDKALLLSGFLWIGVGVTIYAALSRSSFLK